MLVRWHARCFRDMRNVISGLLLVAVTATGAGAVSGTATLTGRTSIAVSPCGHAGRSFAASIQVLGDGTWTAQGDLAASGTYTAVGRTGRKFLLDLDDASSTALIARAETDASLLCRLHVTITGIKRKAFGVVLNRPGTQITVTFKYRINGNAAGHRGHGTVQIKGHGPWTPS